tara:strand:- start:10382 stop:10582 length:201 start_codon:yes stop_codon:yes gene_type:complete
MLTEDIRARDFEGDTAMKWLIVGFVDDTHATFSKSVEDAVATDVVNEDLLLCRFFLGRLLWGGVCE